MIQLCSWKNDVGPHDRDTSISVRSIFDTLPSFYNSVPSSYATHGDTQIVQSNWGQPRYDSLRQLTYVVDSAHEMISYLDYQEWCRMGRYVQEFHLTLRNMPYQVSAQSVATIHLSGQQADASLAIFELVQKYGALGDGHAWTNTNYVIRPLTDSTTIELTFRP